MSALGTVIRNVNVVGSYNPRTWTSLTPECRALPTYQFYALGAFQLVVVNYISNRMLWYYHTVPLPTTLGQDSSSGSDSPTSVPFVMRGIKAFRLWSQTMTKRVYKRREDEYDHITGWIGTSATVACVAAKLYTISKRPLLQMTALAVWISIVSEGLLILAARRWDIPMYGRMNYFSLITNKEKYFLICLEITFVVWSLGKSFGAQSPVMINLLAHTIRVCTTLIACRIFSYFVPRPDYKAAVCAVDEQAQRLVNFCATNEICKGAVQQEVDSLNSFYKGPLHEHYNTIEEQHAYLDECLQALHNHQLPTIPADLYPSPRSVVLDALQKHIQQVDDWFNVRSVSSVSGPHDAIRRIQEIKDPTKEQLACQQKIQSLLGAFVQAKEHATQLLAKAR